MTDATPRSDRLPPGDYRIDPARSRATIHTSHLLGLGKVEATMDVTEGSLHVDAQDDVSSAHAVIDATSFKSPNPRRDKDVAASGFLDSATHRTIEFTSSSVASRPGGWELVGDLTVRGVSRPVTIDVQPLPPGTEQGFTGRTHVHRKDFGVAGPRTATISRDADVELHIVVVPA